VDAFAVQLSEANSCLLPDYADSIGYYLVYNLAAVLSMKICNTDLKVREQKHYQSQMEVKIT
jgi:hypothetical protein